MAKTLSARAAPVFRAVADPTRRALLDLLHQQERTVSELVANFRISQPAISRHLRVLRRSGLVRTRIAGRQRVYRLDSAPLQTVHDWVSRYVADPFGHVWGIRSNKPATPSSKGT